MTRSGYQRSESSKKKNSTQAEAEVHKVEFSKLWRKKLLLSTGKPANSASPRKVDVSPLYSKFVYSLSHREKAQRERMVCRTTARRKEKGSSINSRTPFIESHTNRNDCDVGDSSRKP